MKRRAVITIIFVFLVSFSLNVYAKEKVDISVSKNSVDLGDEITVSINFSKEEQAAYAYTAKLSYDEDVFETIDTENFEEQENWSDINYNTKNNKFALINKTGESGKKLVQIKLKVREEAKQGKTTISIGNVTSTNGKDDISIDGSSVEVQIGKGTQNTTPDEIKDISNEKISVETEKNTLKYFAIIPIVLCLLLIAFLIYINIKNEKINKKQKAIISFVCGIALLVLAIIATIILTTKKTDVNNDEVTDYDDSNKIVDYLLEIENPDEKVDTQSADIDNSQLDTNSDGEISTADVGSVLKDAKNNTRYTSKITAKGNSHSSVQGSVSGSSNQEGNLGQSSGEQSGQGANPGGDVNPEEVVKKVESKNNTNQGVFQVQNSEQVELVFDIEITPKTGVKEVVIGGKKYTATYNEEDGLYHVTLPTADLLGKNKTYGKSSVELTDVVLDNNKNVKLKEGKLSLDIEVLKQQPTIVGEIEYNESNTSITVTFDDPDNALKDGGYIYIETVDNQGKVQKVKAEVQTSKMEADGTKKKFTINIEEFKNIDGTDSDIENGDYNIVVVVPYQLDEDGILESRPLAKSLNNVHIVTDYKFTFSDLKIATKEMADGSKVEDITNNSVKIKFTSTNEAVNEEGLPVTVSKVKVKIETQNGEITEKEVPATPVENNQNKYEIEIEHKGDTRQTISIESVELSNGRKYIKQSNESENNAKKTDVLENQKVTIFLSTPVAQSFELNLGDEQTNITAAYLLQDLDNTITESNVKLELIYKPSQEGEETLLDTIEVPTKTTENTIANLAKKVADYKNKIPNYNYNQGNGIYTVKLYATYSRIDGKKHNKSDETGLIGIATNTRNEEKRKKAPNVTAGVDTKNIPYELTVNVTDEDGAFKTGTVIIKKSDGTVVKTENFSSEQTPYKLELNKEYLENGNYTIEITYTYQEKEGEELKTESITPIELNNFVSDYGVNFEKIDDVVVKKKIEGVQDGQVILKFTATTKTTNYIKTIELDGGATKVGEVTREGNQYTVTIPYESETTKTFQITKLILDNHYAENLDTARTDTLFTIYLPKPQIVNKQEGGQELELTIDETTKQATAKVKIENDQNGTNYRAHLTYPNSSDTIEISLIKGNENEYTGTFGKLADVAGEYKLEILADYDLENGEGLLQNQILGTTIYTVDLEAKIIDGSIQREQPTKEEIVTITYKVHDNTGKAVKYIEVNGKMYTVTSIEGQATDNETTYTVEVPVPLTHKKIDEQTGAPIVEFTATKLVYEGEEEELNPAFTFEQKVQNAKPKYENTFENEDSSKPRMKFNFTDPNGEQKAFRKATVKLKDSNGNVVKTREFTDVDKDYYFLLYNEQEDESINGVHPQGAIEDTFAGMIDGETYSIEVEIEYDVEYEVEGQYNEAPGKITEVIEGLQLNAEYKLKINTKQEETKVDVNTGKTTIIFTSSNALNAEISSVTIEKTVNGNTQTMSNLPISTIVGDKYTIDLETNGEEEYKHEYNIKEVKLKTGVIISNFEDGSETKVATHYVAPVASLGAPVIGSDDTISLALNIKDSEKILKNLKATLYKKQGEQEIWKEDVVPTEVNTIVEQDGKDYTVSFKTNCNEVGTYIIKITGSYERVDGKNHLNEELEKSNVKVEPKITNFILNANSYAEKNQEITLNISEQDNTGSIITKIELIDSKEQTYELDVVSNQAVITSPKEAGEITYTAKAIHFADGTKIELEESLEHQVKVDVLKDMPKVDYKYDDTDKNNPKITVNITDLDKALKDNKVNLSVTQIDGNNKAIISQEIESGKETEITQGLDKLEDGKEYKVEIIGTYDLDNKMGGNNYKENHNFLREDEKIVGFQIKDFALDNINVTNVSRTNNYVEITFNSTNNTYKDSKIGIYYVTHINIEGIAEPIEVTKITQNTEGFDTYTAKIPYEKIDEYRMYKITGAQVLGGKEFTSNEGFGTFEIFKQMPKGIITSAKLLTEGVNAEKIEVKYKIESGLNSITSLKMKVSDKDGASEYVTSDNQIQKPNAEQTEETVILNYMPKYAGSHTIELLLTGVNLNDGKSYGEQILAENRDINVGYFAQIVSTKITVVETKQTAKNQITADKGQEVQIDYEIKTNRPVNENLNSITVNATGNEGKIYPVGTNNKITLEAPIATNEAQGTATYRIKVAVPQDAIAFENINYTVESVQFDTDVANTAILTENVVTIKVQKQVPEILSITYDQQTRTISIKVQDKDNAITQGKIVVKDGENEIITKTFGTDATDDKIEAIDGVYNIVLEKQDNIETKDYKVEVTGKYDIGNGQQELEPLNSDIKIYQGDYGFKLSDAKIEKVENSENNKEVYINFKSSNNHKLLVKAVLVLEEELKSNGIEQIIATQTEKGLEHRCDVSQIGEDEYQIKVPFTNENPKKYTITQAILDNTVAFDNSNSAEFNVEQLKVFKEQPTATDLSLDLKAKTARFAINDPDSTIKTAKAVIINNKTKKEVTEAEIADLLSEEVTFETSVPQGEYILAINAVYNKLDGKGEVNENIGITDNPVSQEIEAKITKIETNNKKLFAKTDPIQVTMHVTDNTDYRITKFYVHCKLETGEDIIFEDIPDYQETPNPNGIYTFTTPFTPTTGEKEVLPGIRTCTVEQIEYDDPENPGKPITVQVEQTDENKAQIEILKDAPTLSWEKQEVDEKTNLIVKLNNPDNARVVHASEHENTQFEAGATIELLKLNPETSEYEKVEIDNKNKLIGTSEDNTEAIRTIELTENGTYELKVNGIAYLADKLTDNAELETITKALAIDQKEIKFVSDYDFKIQNEKVVSVDREAKNATIEFESTNLANELIKEITIDEQTFKDNLLKWTSEGEVDTQKGKVSVYKYTVTLNNVDPDVKREVLFRKATLNGGKEIKDIPNKLVIYKTQPTATVKATIELKEGENADDVDAERIIKGNIQIQDPETSISKTYINVINPDGTLLLKEPKEWSQGEFDFNDYPVSQKGDYTVQLLADYDRNVGDAKTKQVIGEDTVTINVDANIIENTAENYYVEKGGEIKIKYTIEDNAEGTDRFKPNGFNIVKTIDGVESGEEFQTITFEGVGKEQKQNEEYYSLTLKAPEKPQTMKVEVKSISYADTENQTSSKAIMNENDKATTQIDILKNQPKISDYLYSEEQGLRFKLEDTDNSFKSGKVRIEKKSGEKVGEDIAFEKQDGEMIQIKENLPKLEEEQKYKITIEVEYDRTTSEKPLVEPIPEGLKGTITQEQIYHQVKDYQFEYINGIKIEKIDDIAQEIEVSFACSFAKDNTLKLTHAYIVDKFYEVEQRGDRYYVKVKFANTIEKLELKLQGVKFSNGKILKSKDLNIGENGENDSEFEKTDSVYAFLTEPAITNESATFNDEGKINVKFNLNDPDKTVTGIKAHVMVGGSEVTVVDKDQVIDLPKLNEEGTANVDFTIDKVYSNAGTYTVKVLFTYDRHDGKTHNDEPLQNSTLTANIANWAKITTDDKQDESRFIERGEGEKTQIPVIYTIDDNDPRDIEAIKLEGDETECPVEKVAGTENQYKIVYETETTSGEKSFKVEKVVYKQQTVALQEAYTTTVEILKIAPKVEIGEYNPNDRSIKFTIVDPEDTITSGRALITSEDGSTTYKTVDINPTGTEPKEITVTFLTDDEDREIPKNEHLKLKIVATYSLDIKGQKTVENKELALQEIAPLSQEYNFEVQDIKVISVDRENKTAKLEIKVKDNSTQIGGDISQYLMQNFSIQDTENPILVQKESKDEITGITTYTADFAYPNDLDGKRQEYKVNKVQIGANSEEIAPKEFILFKTKPTTQELTIDPEKISTESVTASFKINDPDNALINAKVGLYEYKYYQDYNQYMDIYMDEKEIKENEADTYEIKLDDQKYSTNSKYTVKIEGIYDLADGGNIAQMEEEQTSELIGDEKTATKQFSVPIHSKVEEIKSTGGDIEEDKSIVVDKNKSISMYYRISDNTDLTIKKIVLTDKNNIENPNNQSTWTATKVTTGEFLPKEGEAGDVYKISYGGKALAANAGVQNLEIKQIQYDRSRTADIIEQLPQEFKVRKLMPTVTYAGKGTLNTPQADFTINDPDNAIVGGKLEVEVYGTNDDVNNDTDVRKGERYLADQNIEIDVNKENNIDFSKYGETLPDGTYDLKLKGKYNLYDNDEKNNEIYEITKNLTVVKDLNFTFENLQIFPEYITGTGMLMGMVNIHTGANLKVKEIKLRFYKDQTNTSDEEGTYADYSIDDNKFSNWGGDDLYTIMDMDFLSTEAYKCIKIGQNPLKVLEVVAVNEATGKQTVFKVNELAYANITREQGQLAFFTIAEKTNINKEAKTVSTDLEGYVKVNDLEDYYVPGSLSTCVYDENGELIAEQPIEAATAEDKADLQRQYDEIDKMQISEREKSDKKQEAGYRKDIKFVNIPIAKTYRVEIHGKWYEKYMDVNHGYMEEVQEGIVQMKHRTGIGAAASPSVDARLNLNAKTRVGIEETKTYIKNEKGEWIPSSYVGKGEEVKIEYLIRGNMDAGTHITSATVNKQDVELSGVEGKVDVYETTIKAPEEAGKFNIDLTRVGLNTLDYKYTVDSEEYILNSTPVDVLTEAPRLDNFKLDYENSSTPKLTFDIIEEKGEKESTTSRTIKNATVDVYEYKGNNNEEYKNESPVKSYEFNKTGEKVSLSQIISMEDLARGEQYWLQVKTDYSLVENEDSEVEGITKFSNNILYSSPLLVQSDDNVKITNLKAPSNVEKNQEIELKFNFDAGTEFLRPVKLKVEGNVALFDVIEEEGTFKANITGYSVSGKQTINLKQIVLNTGKVIDLPESINHKVNVEICKDIVGVKYFAFSESGNEIILNVSLKDKEGTLVDVADNVQINIYESDSNEKINGVKVEGNKALDYTAKFNSNNDVRKYKAVIKATYSKLEDKENNSLTEEIYSREFSLDDRTIEIKDITNIELMKFENGVTRAVEGLTKEELDRGEQYLVRVSMLNTSTFYSDIGYYEEKNGKLVLTLNYVGATQYTEGKEGSITVELEDSNTKIQYNNQECTYYVSTNSFTGLVYLLKHNPDKEITLNTDLDATSYVGDTSNNVYIDKTFTGKINGNGHMIKNLQMPLFNEINGATIENVNIVNTVVIAKSQNVGILANTAIGAKIKRVNFTGVVFNVSNNCGTMFNQANGNTTIEECELTGLTLTYTAYNNSHVGGMVNRADNVVIKNCRVEGTIGGWPGWQCLAGVVANPNNVVLENCITNVDVNSAYGTQYSCGSMVGAGSSNLIIRNCVSISDGGNVSSIIKDGCGINSQSTNNYGCSALTAGNKTFKYQEKEKFTQDFYKNTIRLDEGIWDLTNCGGEVLPKLKPLSSENKPTNPNAEIPGYERIKEQSDYNASKEILYHNLSKLAPYYDAKYIIEDAKNINESDELNQKLIQGILPIDKNGKIVNSLTNENYQNIERIKLVFKDRTIKEYKVDFETYFGNVVCYNIPSINNVKYNFKNYVINKDASIVKELVDYVKNINYVLSIDTLTKTKDSRLYSETFDDSSVQRDDKKYSTIFKENTVKQEAEQVILDLLSNNNYNITNDDVKTASVIKNELLSNNRLERYLLTYTYVKRWYNINVEDYNLKDILLYHTDIFEGEFNYDTLTTRLLLNDSNMATSATHTFYANNIGNTIGLPQIGDFIDYFIKNTGKYDDVNDWLVENFNGFIVETKLDNQDDRLRYRAWDYLKCWPSILLPVLRLPEKSAYIYSCPTQIHVGATRVYYADPVKNADAMQRKIESFASSVKRNYEGIYGMIGGGSSDTKKQDVAIYCFNRKNDLQTDTNIANDGEYVNGKLLSRKAWQYANQTQEDYHKWFAEATGIWTARIGAAAYAYGTRILWEDNALLDNFKIWSHETMHDQDGALILKNHNRRPAVGGESYSDGFLTQSYEKPGFCKFNFSVNYDSNTSHTVNWTGDRISSPEKVEDYYTKAFQLNYVLDYIIGQAVLELSRDQQEKVLSKMPETETKPSRAGKDFEKVESIDDLIEGQYAIDYGAEGYKTIRWYNPLSDVNFTSVDNLWVMSYEMLGYAGYDNGWLLWTTDILKSESDPYVSDKHALAEITKRKTGAEMDIKAYKKARFNEAAENADKLSYLNKEDIKNQFLQTLIQDASEVKSDVGTLQMSKTSALKIQIFNQLKRYTDDLRSTPFGKQANNEEVTVNNGKQFIDEITKNSSAKIKLGSDIDLSEYNSGNCMIRSTFAGEINGNGKKITGVNIPIFDSTLSAKFENFTIENPEISIDKTILGALSNTTEKSNLTRVKVKGGTIDSKGKETVGALVGQSKETTFDECSVEGTTIKGARNVGGLIGNATNVDNIKENQNTTTIKNSYTYKVTIEGTTKVGGLIGNLEKYAKIEKSSSLDVNVNGSQDSVGGLVGEINKGSIENSYSTGTVTGKRNYCGGLVGYSTDPEIKNCYTTCKVKGQSYIGGFIGTVRNSGIVENCISLAIMESSTAAKFDTGSNSAIITNGFKNNYEIAEFIGRPSSNNSGVQAGNIMAIAYNGANDTVNQGKWLNGLNNKAFWDHNGDANIRDYGVKFDETIWKIPTDEELSKGELPTLLGAGNPVDTKVMKPQNIQSQSEQISYQPEVFSNNKPVVVQKNTETKNKKQKTTTNSTKIEEENSQNINSVIDENLTDVSNNTVNANFSNNVINEENAKEENSTSSENTSN